MSFIVPRHARRGWLDEWRAELWILDHQSAGSPRTPSPLLLGLGALTHSLWQRKEWTMSLITQDVRAALRALRRNPGFTALALFTMALGIGANTTIFSMANATLLRSPGGIDDPGRIVQIGRDRADEGFDSMAYPFFRDFQQQAGGLEALAAYSREVLQVGRGSELAVRIGQLVSGEYFPLLGVRAEAGRLLGPADDRTLSAHPVAVISHALWVGGYGADPDVIGRTVAINGTDFEIVGVAERGFQGTEVVGPSTEVWIPLMMLVEVLGDSYANYNDYGFSWLWLVGRLADDTAPEALRAELDSIYGRGYVNRYAEQPDHGIGVVPGVGLRPEDRSAVARLMVALMAVVAVVLAVACANLANLLLARGIGRSQELGIRTALGASRARLVRELLTESVVLALGGGLLALLITYWTTGLIPRLLPISMGVSFRPDLTVFAFALAMSLAAGVLFGLVPALRSSRANLVETLKEASPLAGRHAGWLRGGLVAGQLALSFMLLAITGLLVQSLLRASAAQPGYNTRDVLTMSVSLETAGYERGPAEQFFEELVTRAAALPGVHSAAWASNLPFAGWSRRSVTFPEHRADLERQFVEIDTTNVGARWFETLQIPLLAGETFSPANSGPEMPMVVVVSQSAAETFWPGQDPVGELLPLTEDRAPERSMRVIGVVADVQVRSLREPPRASIYLPASQHFDGTRTLYLRTAGDPGALTRPLQGLLRELDADLGVRQMGVLHDRMSTSLRDTLTVARLGGIFGLLAVALAAIGLYGVVSYVASSRTHEVGVRMALGARAASVLGLFARQTVMLTAAGIMLGSLLTLAAGGAVASFLYGVSPRDPATLTLIGAGVLLIAVLASARPALRASRLDPVTALRRK